ncbi:MAG: YihY/virulence factor BrkB family protein, partial [Acidimicrobiales bacterium]
IAAALFSASGAVGQLISALNVIFDHTESRKFLAKRLLALALLIGAILMVGGMVFAMAIVPEWLEDWTNGGFAKTLVELGRFVALGLALVGGLSILYRVAPGAPKESGIELVPGGRRPIFSIGAVVGGLLIVGLSWGFGVFVRNFGSYNETYGALAAVIVVLLWLQLISVAVLLGAEVDASRRDMLVDQARIDAGLPPMSY